MTSSHAIVIGGSVAGILTARALSNHFGRVTVIERDTLPQGPEYRDGVPQAHHAHALLAQGQTIMQEFFPTLKADLAELGSPEMHWGWDTATMSPGGWLRRFKTGIVTNVCSRIGLEWLLRRRLAEMPNVSILEQQEVTALLSNAERDTITGVALRSRADRSEQTILGDLVVDASGRGSKTPEWLKTLGYTAPEETVVNAFLGYSSCWYTPPANFEYAWKVLLVNSRPQWGIKRGGAAFVVEGNRWIVTLAGMNRDYPPTDHEGFLEFAKSLTSPYLYEAIHKAEPISPVYGYRRTDNRQRHYEKQRMPENFIVMGDAYCCFNPIYGQGMTAAAIEARLLNEVLAGYKSTALQGFSKDFHQRLAKFARHPWLMATGEDLRYPETEGELEFSLRLAQKYIDRFVRILPYSEEASQAFMELMNLTRKPHSLLTPKYMLLLLRHFRESAELNDSINLPIQRYTDAQ